VAGTSGKAILEGGSDDEGASTEAQGRAIVEVLGRAKRDEVLAAIYMVRSDVSLTVRQVFAIFYPSVEPVNLVVLFEAVEYATVQHSRVPFSRASLFHARLRYMSGRQL
jgi:hypothetical protein